MKRWEKIVAALDSEERYLRARYMFELLEEERRDGVRLYIEYSLPTEIKKALTFYIEHSLPTEIKKALTKKHNSVKVDVTE